MKEYSLELVVVSLDYQTEGHCLSLTLNLERERETEIVKIFTQINYFTKPVIIKTHASVCACVCVLNPLPFLGEEEYTFCNGR